MEYFFERMKKILGNDFDEFVSSFQKEKNNGLRANILKTNLDELMEILKIDFEKIPYCKDGAIYRNAKISKSPYYYAGLFYLQEASAMLPASVMQINSGDLVLDLCAAPGGKTTYLGSKLSNTGILVSNDISASRAKAIIKNIELFGIKNAVVTSETPKKLSDKFGNTFNKILVDAPCSGEGMLKSNKEVLKSYNNESNKYYSEIQKEILKYARLMLADGGEILYSTCTFSPIENEFVIKDFLDNNPDFELIKLAYDDLKISRGIDIGDERLLDCGRIWPHKSVGEGHFVAYMKQKSEPKKINLDFIKTKAPKNIDIYYEFAEKNFCNTNFDNLNLIDNKLYSFCDNMPDFSGIRVLRGDFCLGEIKTKRFEPSQALAMSLKTEEFKNIVELSETDALRYLEGESFEVSANEGYNLVCIKKFPLGFGKVIDGRLKNKYSKSWRI